MVEVVGVGTTTSIAVGGGTKITRTYKWCQASSPTTITIALNRPNYTVENPNGLCLHKWVKWVYTRGIIKRKDVQ